VADLRFLQGFLQDWGPGTDRETRHDEHLVKIGGRVARKLAKQADRLESELGLWREEA
jgi:hypothetical protein